MKVKLLKIIRNRYSIIRIDKLGRREEDIFYRCRDKWGLPMFAVQDDGPIRNTVLCENYESAYAELCSKIRAAYGKYSNRRGLRNEKVWHNG